MKVSPTDFSSRLQAFLTGESGATAIEYSLIAASIGLVTAVAFSQIGQILQDNYYNILASLF